MSRGRTRNSPPPSRCWPTPSACSACARSPTPRLYESDQAVLAGLGGVWKRVGELARIDPQFAAYVEARDGIKSQLEDLAFFLRATPTDRRLAGAAAAGRGSSRPARAAEAEVRSDARR